MAAPNLHPLTSAHADATAALIRTVFAEHLGRIDPPPSALKETGANIATILARGGGAGASIDGTLVACVIWEEKSGGLYFGRLAVAQAARGLGLARALIAAAEAEARRRSLPHTHLSVRLALADNRKLFASCGYLETAQHAHPGYAAPTFADMAKTLA